MPRLGRQGGKRLGRDARDGPAPAGVDHGEASLGHEHHGHAVRVAEQDGDARRRADHGVRALARLVSDRGELRGLRRGDDHDMVPMDLPGIDQPTGEPLGAERGECPEAVLGNGGGVVTAGVTEVE